MKRKPVKGGPYNDLPLETLRKLQDILDPEQPL